MRLSVLYRPKICMIGLAANNLFTEMMGTKAFSLENTIRFYSKRVVAYKLYA